MMTIKDKIIKYETRLSKDKKDEVLKQLKKFSGAQYLIRLKYNAFMQEKKINELCGYKLITSKGIIRHTRDVEEEIIKDFDKLLNKKFSDEQAAKIELMKNELTNSGKIIRLKKQLKNYENNAEMYKNKELLRSIISRSLEYTDKLLETDEMIEMIIDYKEEYDDAIKLEEELNTLMSNEMTLEDELLTIKCTKCKKIRRAYELKARENRCTCNYPLQRKIKKRQTIISTAKKSVKEFSKGNYEEAIKDYETLCDYNDLMDEYYYWIKKTINEF